MWNQLPFGRFLEKKGKALRVVRQRPAPVPAGGRTGRSGLVEGFQESGQGVGCLGRARCGSAVGWLSRNPGGHDPGPLEPGGRRAQALRDGHRQRQARCDAGQPGVLLEQQPVRARGRPGQPDGELVAEPPQLVVPAPGARRHRKVSQIGVLVAEQPGDQVGADLWRSGIHAGHRTR
jgi:hypothetical protein